MTVFKKFNKLLKLFIIFICMVQIGCNKKSGSTEEVQNLTKEMHHAEDPLHEHQAPDIDPHSDAHVDNHGTDKTQSTCFYSSYLRGHNKEKLSKDEAKNFLILLENHGEDPSHSEDPYKENIDNHESPQHHENNHDDGQCKKECNDLNMNKIYESILSKNIMFNKTLSIEIGKVFKKILKSMRSKMGNEGYKRSLQAWASNKDPALVFPVTQKKDLFKGRTFGADGVVFLTTKEMSLKYSIGAIKNAAKKENPIPNPALQLDYLIFNSKLLDKIGIFPAFEIERNYYFDAIVRRLRGYRGNQPAQVLRTQYGILNFDIPNLEAPQGSYPWRHWARDSCINDPEGSMYARAAVKHQVPLACGISGTTNLALWSLIYYHTDLNEEEVRLFLLSVWSTLCADGGHSLQEVLTQAKLTAIYLRGLIQYEQQHDQRHEQQHDQQQKWSDKISAMTLASLESVVSDVNPLGIDQHHILNESKTDMHYSEINKKIYEKQYQVLSNEVKEISANEKEMREELESYFNHYANQDKLSGFGNYYDSFFSKLIHDEAFEAVREETEEELEKYFSDYCSGRNPSSVLKKSEAIQSKMKASIQSTKSTGKSPVSAPIHKALDNELL